MARRPRILMMVVTLLIVAAACSSGNGGGGSTGPGGSGASGSGQQGGTFKFPLGADPTKLIPQNDYESAGAQVFNAIFTRLMTYDADTNAPVPAQAKSVTSDDQMVWTIEIQPGWTFHNGEPVTAQSYVDAWNWGALGSNGAILNFFFEKIQGYDELNPAKGDATTTELSGLKVVNDTTFTVTLTAPFSQFPIELGFDAFDPLPKAFFDDPDAYNEKPIGDGPYMLTEWKHDQTIVLERYPDYQGTPGYADRIELPIYSSSDASWADFQAGNLDISFVGSSNFVDAQQNYSDSLTEEPSSLFLYLGLPLYDPRFQNKELRQALSLAVDRQAVMNAVLVAETPADAFTAPVVPGYQSGTCTYCTYDPALAKQKLAAAGGWQGTMTINLYSNDATLEQAMEAIGNQWKQNLGIDFELNVMNYNSYYDTTINHKFTGPWWDGWVMDYPSLEDYLRPLYGSTGSYNGSGYSNPAFDSLLKQGDEADSIEASIAKYQQAADIVAEDMPVIPWGFLPSRYVHQPTVTNVHKAGPLENLELADIQVVQ
jgi:oligopeptide transport system substrate-binding protein